MKTLFRSKSRSSTPVYLSFMILAGISSAQAQSCQTTTAFLDSRLPHWEGESLINMRQKAISEDIMLAMRNAGSQGIKPDEAVRMTLQQAKSYDEDIKKSLAGAMDVDALGTTDEQFLDRLNNGKLAVKSCDDGNIKNINLCVAIVNKMAAVVMRSIAAEMQCHIRAGTWPQ